MKDIRARLDALSVPEPNSGCVLWMGTTNWKGYPGISIGNRHHQAHRVAYELVKGPIPNGLHLDHLCRVRCCINPDHLEPVTRRENILRGVGLAAVNAKKTHCKRGHEFTTENTRYRVARYGLSRECRTCNREVHAPRARLRALAAHRRAA